MANSLKAVDVVQIAVSPTFTTVYTVPSATKFTVSMLHLCNTTSSPVTVRVCVVPNAGSPTAANAVMWDFSVAANDILELFKGDIWGAGVTLQANASAGTAVNIKLSGIEST